MPSSNRAPASTSRPSSVFTVANLASAAMSSKRSSTLPSWRLTSTFQKSVSLWKVLVKRQDGSVDDRLELIAALARLATVKTDEGRLVEAGALLEEGMRGLDALPAAAANRPALHQERVETYF